VSNDAHACALHGFGQTRAKNAAGSTAATVTPASEPAAKFILAHRRIEPVREQFRHARGFSANCCAGREPSFIGRAQLAKNIAKPSIRGNINLAFILFYTSLSAIIQVLDELILSAASHGHFVQQNPKAERL